MGSEVIANLSDHFIRFSSPGVIDIENERYSTNVLSGFLWNLQVLFRELEMKNVCILGNSNLL